MKTNTSFCSATPNTWKEASHCPSKIVVLATFAFFMAVVGSASEYISPASPRYASSIKATEPTVHVAAATGMTSQAFRYVMQRLIQKTRTFS